MCGSLGSLCSILKSVLIIFNVFEWVRKKGMTITSALTFIGYFEAVDLATSYPKLLPGTAHLPQIF